MFSSYQACTADNAIFGQLSCIRSREFKPSECAGDATRTNRANNSACISAGRDSNSACISADLASN
jgi:hypothetical protein